MSGIPACAVRGAKCICVAAGWDRAVYNDPEGLMQFPVKNAIYTVREVRVRYVTEWGGEVLVGLTLEEVVNPIASGGSSTGEEPGWHIDCFRPVSRLSAAKDVAEHFGHHLDQRQPERV